MEVMEYFTRYIGDDRVGIISNNRLTFVVWNPKKQMVGKCVDFPKLFLIVTFSPKTGVCVEIPELLRVRIFQDFMESPHHITYDSKLGNHIAMSKSPEDKRSKSSH